MEANLLQYTLLNWSIIVLHSLTRVLLRRTALSEWQMWEPCVQNRANLQNILSHTGTTGKLLISWRNASSSHLKSRIKQVASGELSITYKHHHVMCGHLGIEKTYNNCNNKSSLKTWWCVLSRHAQLAFNQILILPQHLKDKAANPIYSYARRIMTWGSLQCHMSLVLCRPEGKKNSWWSIIIIIINIYRSTSSSRSIEHEYNMVISANDHGGVLSMTTILEKMRLAEYHHSEDEYQIS